MANYMKPIPSYQTGGDVHKDQVANVDKGERVLNPQESAVYKLAEAGKAPATVLGKISERAHELYNQGKALSAPEDSEAQSFKEKQANIDAALGHSAPTAMQPLAPVAVSPMDKVNPSARYGQRGQEKRLDFEGNEINPNTPAGMRALGPQKPVPQGLQTLPSYDEGGDVPDDQTAQLHEAEHVLEPEKAAAYRQAESEVLGGSAMPKEGAAPAPKEEPSTLVPEKVTNPLGDTGAPRSTEMKMLPMQSAPEPLQVTPEVPKPQAPDPMNIIHADKAAAMQKGAAGLSDLGTSLIHERVLGGKASPDVAASVKPPLTPETPVMPEYTGMKRIGAGTPGEAEAHKQFEEKRQDYDQRIQAAMDQGTPEGDREAASLQLAKLHFEKMNPLGSAANKPGVLGKIEHGLAKAGNIAGDIVAPGTTALIPGSDLNKNAKAQALREQEGAATKESLEQAQARVAGAKPVPGQVYDWAMRGNNGKPQINPDTNQPFTPPEAQVLSTGTGKTPLQVLANGLQHEVNPDTGKNYTPVESLEEAMKRQAGNKLNEHQRRVADYVNAHHMEDTPQNREAARIAIEKADTEAKQQSELPFSEQKSKFNNTLATTRALLVQQGADSNARGLKADELQNTENARSASVTAKIQTAKDALNNADQEQFAAQITPILSLMAVSGAEGIKRVNKTELDRFTPASGSFSRWADAHADQFFEGKIPAEYKEEVGHMLDRMLAADVAEHIINTRSIDSTVRQGAQQPVQLPGGGASAKPEPSKPQAPPEIPTEQSNKYHLRGSKGEIVSNDGKTWYDLQGKKIGAK